MRRRGRWLAGRLDRTAGRTTAAGRWGEPAGGGLGEPPAGSATADGGSRRAGVWRAVGLLASLILLYACGVPSQEQPVVIDPTNVPNRLLATAGPEHDSTPTPDRETNPVTYFVESGRLVGVERDVPDASLQRRLQDAIQALLMGPSEAEQSAGLGTAIPNGLLLTVEDIKDGEAIIELTGELQNAPTNDNVLAVAQIVLTATAQPEIDRVRLTRDGEAIDAPLIGGTLKDTALTADDYEPLLPGR